jgi:hypothetical protein
MTVTIWILSLLLVAEFVASPIDLWPGCRTAPGRRAASGIFACLPVGRLAVALHRQVQGNA